MILAVASLKGGAGKTTTAIALTMAARARGLRVLLVDLDPQGTATLWMGEKKSRALADWFLTGGQKKLSPLVVAGDLLPAGSRLAAVPPALSAKAAPDFILSRGLRPLAQDYDLTILDCPPGDNRLTSNALFAAERMIVPVQPGSIDGLVSLLHLTREWRELTNAPVAELGGVVLTRGGQTNLCSATADWIRGRYKGAFLEPIVPNTVQVQQAWHDRKPLQGDAGGRATEAYGEITEKLLHRIRRWAR